MKNRKLLLIVSLALAMMMSLGGTLAYLTDTDADVNTMVLGNVQIVQNEQERDANGELVEFTQDKPLLPAVYTGDSIPWDPATEADQAWKFVEENVNVLDKIVTVTNQGNTPAYVRTLVAFEGNEDDIHFVANGSNVTPAIAVEPFAPVEITIGGKAVTYSVVVFTYPEALGAKETTIPSLKQVYLDKAVDNEQLIQYGETYDILVISQAVQASGFTSAAEALNAGFNNGADLTADVIKGWFEELYNEDGSINQDMIGSPSNDGVNDKNNTNNPPAVVNNLEELKAAFAEGGHIQLADDIKMDKITAIEPGKEVHLDLNGKTITVDQETQSNTLIWVKEGAKLVVDGNGTIDLEGVSTMAIFAPYGELVIENGTFIRDKFGAEDITNETTGLFMGCKVTSSNVTINGGYFDPGYYDENAADIEDILAGTVEFTETEDDIAKRGNSKDANLVRVAVKDNVSVLLNHSGYGTFKVYGGTFVGANPAWGDEGCMMPTTPNYLRPWSYYQGALLAGQTFNENDVVIPDGYTITQSKHADGRPVYTVNYSK